MAESGGKREARSACIERVEVVRIPGHASPEAQAALEDLIARWLVRACAGQRRIQPLSCPKGAKSALPGD